MATRRKLQLGEHFLHPRDNVAKLHLIFTILRRWGAPSPRFRHLLLHLLLLFYYPYNQQYQQGSLFPLRL
ncbi:hypothetical protein U1Q18_037694, partial [Sarracenia purpurea var. burkii]